MPAPFKQITVEQFAELLSSFPFTRHINAVHMHHTWRPNRAQYHGHDTIVGMWRVHTQENHWSDIAQHITIAPDGSIWLGRDWNRAPASARGHNGNEQAGPFMFETIGDFDRGQDPFDGAQRQTVLEVIARVQRRFNLSPGTLQFHNMMSAKTCPGNSIDYQTVLGDVAAVHTRLMQETGREAPRPFPRDLTELPRDVREAIEDLQRPTARAGDPPDAEPCAHHHAERGRDDGAYRGDDVYGGARTAGRGLGAADEQALKPHIVNLNMGRFAADDQWTTLPSDVDAIFEEHLPAAAQAARERGRPLKLMFYAHGGLNSGKDALAAARSRIDWWTANDIYPVYFIWHTGFVEILKQMLERRQGSRGLLSDHISDPLVEKFAHRFGGVQIWGAMKWSAQQSSAANVEGGPARAAGASAGGAWYVADKLAAFCKAHPEVEVHAVGHSAGSIFHSHFIPRALEQGVPKFESLHLMAPAIRTDLFRQQLEPLVGKRIGQLTMYTMYDTSERKDTCDMVYRKSLLYLIHGGLEPEVAAPILGLERCVRADPALKQLFGIGLGGKGGAEIVWSPSELASGRSASRACAHGAFDDDPATMGSIVRRIQGLKDADRIVELPKPRGVNDPWHAAPDDDDEDDDGIVVARPFADSGWTVPEAAGGKRRALCVGIDTYPSAPLGGCVNDARAWAGVLRGLGFETTMLENEQATRDGIMSQLVDLVGASGQGDVIVFQYAGHGTQVPDLDGDELGGDTPGEDEALCPYDFASGNLLVDDDMRAIFRRLPDGVNLTCFFDCCHSGTITRFAIGSRPGTNAQGKRARFVPATPTLVANYTARRSAMQSRAAPGGSLETMREVVFSACLSSEVALESDGHGEFTRNAMRVFAQGVDGISNDEFADRVTRGFGAAPPQHAKLYGSDTGRARALLQPLSAPLRGRATQQEMASLQERAALAANELVRVSQLLVPRR